MKKSSTKEKVDKLTIEPDPEEDDVTNLTMTVSWGPYRLDAPVKAHVGVEAVREAGADKGK